MIFKTYTFVILLLLPSLIYAQNSEPVVAKAFYKFTHQYDTTNTNLIKTENYVLLLGKLSSVYKSYDRAIQDSEILANYKLTGAMAPPAGTRADPEELYNYFDTKKTFLKVSSALGNYIIEKPFNEVIWKVDKETKKIENVQCQKATTRYMGRDYVAWFTSSYPFQAGPWKLHGLPGLIITAYDKTGRIRFDFRGFKQIKDQKEETVWDKKIAQITYEDYKKLAKAFEIDPIGFLEKRFNTKITVGTTPPHRNILLPSKSINFPLEVENNTSK